MAAFHFNPFSGESRLSQWNNHLQQREHFSDIASAIKAQTNAYRSEIQRARKDAKSSLDAATKAQAEAISSASDVVVGSMESGFSGLADGLSGVSEGISGIQASISDVGRMLDWRLTLMIDQQRVSNLLLENVALLLRIPDVQKERQYHIEQGFKHYKNAAIDADLYQDALANLLEAEKREKTDYVVLHRIGMIYLHAPKPLLDLPKAEDYFKRAAKYATAESDMNATPVFNILAGDVTKRLAEQSIQSISTDMVKMIAAESFFQASIACYEQEKFQVANELAMKAYSLVPSMLEARFVQAKALAAAGAADGAVVVQESLIKTKAFYAIKTSADPELASNAEIRSLLVRLRDRAVAEARARIEHCRRAMIPQSKAAPLIDELAPLLQRNNYLDAIAVLAALTKPRRWINLSGPHVGEPVAPGRATSIDWSIEKFVILEKERFQRGRLDGHADNYAKPRSQGTAQSSEGRATAAAEPEQEFGYRSRFFHRRPDSRPTGGIATECVRPAMPEVEISVAMSTRGFAAFLENYPDIDTTNKQEVNSAFQKFESAKDVARKFEFAMSMRLRADKKKLMGLEERETYRAYAMRLAAEEPDELIKLEQDLNKYVQNLDTIDKKKAELETLRKKWTDEKIREAQAGIIDLQNQKNLIEIAQQAAEGKPFCILSKLGNMMLGEGKEATHERQLRTWARELDATTKAITAANEIIINSLAQISEIEAQIKRAELEIDAAQEGVFANNEAMGKIRQRLIVESRSALKKALESDDLTVLQRAAEDFVRDQSFRTKGGIDYLNLDAEPEFGKEFQKSLEDKLTTAVHHGIENTLESLPPDATQVRLDRALQKYIELAEKGMGLGETEEKRKEVGLEYITGLLTHFEANTRTAEKYKGTERSVLIKDLIARLNAGRITPTAKTR